MTERDERVTAARRAYAEAEVLRIDAWRAANEATREGRPSGRLWAEVDEALRCEAEALEALRKALRVD